VSGLVLYGLFLAYHGLEVTHRLGSGDRTEAEGWVQLGGAGFVLSTCRMNVFLFNLPGWVTAPYLVLALLGLAGWRGDAGTRAALTAGAYVAAFALVGKPFNNYWGLMFAPLLAFGVVRAPAALRDLVEWHRLAAVHRTAGGSLSRR
jgi:hypothetical protein